VCARISIATCSARLVQTVIVCIGLNDLAGADAFYPAFERASADDVIAGLRQLIGRAHEYSLTILGCTISLMGGNTSLPSLRYARARSGTPGAQSMDSHQRRFRRCRRCRSGAARPESATASSACLRQRRSSSSQHRRRRRCRQLDQPQALALTGDPPSRPPRTRLGAGIPPPQLAQWADVRAGSTCSRAVAARPGRSSSRWTSMRAAGVTPARRSP
jgi:hypothetical protein